MNTIQMYREYCEWKLNWTKKVLKIAIADKAKEITLLQLRNKIWIQTLILKNIENFIEWLADDELDKQLSNS